MKSLCSVSLFLPLFAFVSCILLSIVKDFHEANRTHCNVFNVLPSISASISDFYPQNTLWRLCIGLDSFPRYLIAIIYYNRYYSLKADMMKSKRLYKWLVKCGFAFHFVELTSLLMLTYVSSIEIYTVHAISFILFLISSSIYMIITIASYHWPQDRLSFGDDEVDHLNDLNNNQLSSSSSNISSNRKAVYQRLKAKEATSYKYKLRVFLFYISSFLISLYFFIRHNKHCEPYVYSLFSLFEYLTVLANIAYHMTIFFDMSLFDSGYKITLVEHKQE